MPYRRVCRFVSLGPAPISYEDGFDLQQAAATARRAGSISDTMYLLEHSPTITIGRSARGEENLRTSRSKLVERGFAVVETDRGGDITYHGPGQLVGYSILDLEMHGRDLHAYIRNVERVLIGALSGFGITATTVLGRTGVWTNDAKIAAIGIKVSRWISSHGFALNVDADLSPMRRDIVPCGIADKDVTSMREQGVSVSRWDVEREVIDSFGSIFDIEPEYMRCSVDEELEHIKHHVAVSSV